MKFVRLRLTALILAAAVLLTGCGALDFGGYFGALRSLAQGTPVVPYVSMTYERPDMAQLQQTLDTACEAANGEDVQAIMDAVYGFYDAYDRFDTCYSLADIRYSGDLTDTYWAEEYSFCAENSAAVDAALQTLYHTLAASPVRAELEEDYFGAGFFDGYEEDTLWDETFTAMLEEEARLQNRFYELSGQVSDSAYGTQAYYDACADDMASLLAELIALRQEMAEYWLYPDYPQFANDFYYYRDYSAEEEARLIEEIRQELVPLYQELNTEVWEAT